MNKLPEWTLKTIKNETTKSELKTFLSKWPAQKDLLRVFLETEKKWETLEDHDWLESIKKITTTKTYINNIWYKELLDSAFEKAKEDWHRARSVVPALLGLDILWKEEISSQDIILNKDLLDKIKEFYGTKIILAEEYCTDTNFLEKLIFIAEQEIFWPEQLKTILSQGYDTANKFASAIEEKNYKDLTFLNIDLLEQGKTDKDRFGELRKHFWDGIYVYIFDSLHNKVRPIHDAVEQTEKLLDFSKDIIESWKINKNHFIRAILKKIAHSNSGYQEFNNFLNTRTKWRQEKLQKELDDPAWIKEPEFVENAEYILEEDKSWNLYKHIDWLDKLQNILKNLAQSQTIRKLNKLAESEDQKDKKLYKYYKSWVFNLRNNVPDLFLDMYKDPESFLWLNDNTLWIWKVQQNKKPTHMVQDFPYLDFTAEELTSTLPLWIYEQISYFQPKQINYFINKTNWKNNFYTQEEIVKETKKYLSTFNNNKIKTKIVKSYPDKLRYNSFSDDLEKLSIREILDIVKILIDNWIQEFNKYKNLQQFTAEITPKSDSSNWFNGFNCDKLSPYHWKKVVAMFNPYCIDFCVYQWEKSDKVDNLKVTSRVTLNRHINKPTSELIQKLKNTDNPNITKELWEEFNDMKDTEEYFIIIDNIEADQNFTNKKPSVIKKIYSDFFSQYIKENPISPNWTPINTNKYYCGQWYNKINFLDKTETNKNIPVFVNSYTDNNSEKSYVWELNAWKNIEKEKKDMNTWYEYRRCNTYNIYGTSYISRWI